MTKTELLHELEKQTYCGKLLGVEEVQLNENDFKKTNNIKWYLVSFMEIVDKVCKVRKISMYVFDAETENEAAYYEDKEPEQSIKVKEII